MLLIYGAFAWFILGAAVEGAPGSGGAAASDQADRESAADDVAQEVDENGSGWVDEERYCPGYRPGNPGLLSDVDECVTGAGLGVVDHMNAFGIGSHVRSPNWTACGLPVLPNENERVCYKTTVLRCEDGYRIYLNRRNPLTLQSACPHESDALPLAPSNGVFLQSPRYGCRNSILERENNFFKYRKSEFCLYDVSLPNCTSGRVVIDNELHNTQELERRQRYRICSDYVQFSTSSTSSEKYCDSELSRLKLEIPSTHFTALFWTDTSYNKLGFKLRVSCVNESV